MLNIDTRLIDLVKDGLLNTDEFFILLLITKRINIKREAFPAIKLLMEESKFGRDKVIKALQGLNKKGYVKKIQRHIKGRLSSNLYTIHTNLIGVYISADNAELPESTSLQSTENQYTENQYTENQTISINQSSISINQSIEVKKTSKKFDAEKYIKDLDIDMDIKETLIDWIEIRKTKKAPTTQKAIDLTLKDLKNHPKDIQIEMINQSIKRGWTGVFEINKQNNQKQIAHPQASKNIFIPKITKITL